MLRVYGDSWTEGQGANLEKENSLKNRDELQKFRNEFSWAKVLSDKINLEHTNDGLSGHSNLKIFNKISSDVKNGIITKNDLVIIMWSSSLRDTVNFLPNNEWISWSVRELINTPNRFINSFVSGDEKYDNFLQTYKELYISELFNQNYYNIVNQKYIIFIQKLLEFYNVKYIMCDGFERMIIDLNKKDDITKHINKDSYWGFNNKCLREYLTELKRDDIWEVKNMTKDIFLSLHPNKIGYQIISDVLYNFLKKLKYV